MTSRVAVVTGSNKGIGFAIVKELCKRGVEVVFLTSRDIARGKQAIEELKKEGFNPLFHQLDVTDKISVKTFADYLKKQHGGIDILINNAAVIPQNFRENIYEESKYVIDTNYYSCFIVQEYLFPILNDNARVINISSDCGHITNLKNKYWIDRLIKEGVKVEDINAFVNWFLDSVKNNTVKSEDFKVTAILAYRISKVALSALTRIQQREVGRGISVNSLHPGFVQTSMTKGLGLLTIEQAAQAPVFLALDIDQSVKGKYFWFDKTEKEWTDTTLELFSAEDFKNFERNIKETFGAT